MLQVALRLGRMTTCVAVFPSHPMTAIIVSETASTISQLSNALMWRKIFMGCFLFVYMPSFFPTFTFVMGNHEEDTQMRKIELVCLLVFLLFYMLH